MTPPKPKPRNLTLTVNCSKCGHGIVLASGYNASAMSRESQLKALDLIGWTFIPRILCRSCSCPMEIWQMHKARDIYLANKRDTNNDLSLFRGQMIARYKGQEKAIERWFRTINQYEK